MEGEGEEKEECYMLNIGYLQMIAEVSDEVKKRIWNAYRAGDLTTVKSILNDYPDSIHASAKIGTYSKYS